MVSAKCDEKCWDAKKEICQCSCGGKNHGIKKTKRAQMGLFNDMRANYEIIQDEQDGPIIIKDMGPWDKFSTITNAAENVVKELTLLGKLTKRRKLLYYDSENELTEIVVIDGFFYGFNHVVDVRKYI